MRSKFIWFLAIFLLVACARPASRSTPSLPTATPVPPDTGWRLIQPGLEYRELDVTLPEHFADRLRLARVNPALLRLRVRYDPAQPARVSQWLDRQSALLAVNGGYFDPQNRALSLLIQEGTRTGQPYEGFGGMFAVKGDEARVRWNVTDPYQPGEALDYALQNFPMLVLPGGQPNTGIDDNGDRASRTVIGQDQTGRIVLIVSPARVFTLTGFGAWLAASDLALDVALNLDGGSSSGLLVRAGAEMLGVDSWVPVPEVIVVEPATKASQP